MSWVLRCRGPAGQATLSGLDPDMTVEHFQQQLADKTGVPPSHQEILCGFPPKALQLPEDRSVSLKSLPLANGDTLTVRQSASASAVTPSPAAAASSPPPSSTSTPNAPDWAQDDADLARALAASLADSAGPSIAPSAPSSGYTDGGRAVSNATTSGNAAAPSSMAMPDGSCVTRRIIDSDNSCLFNAVGYVMEHSKQKAAELRQIIASVVSTDPLTYNEGFLGSENAEYCKWIQNKDKWGGAIELFILSQYYGREIAAYDIQTKRVDIYGQDSGYTERAMVIYDGLHYDSLAVSAFEGAPEDLDITIMDPTSQEGLAIQEAATKLVEAAHKAKQFTDTANFKLRCGVCQIGLKGEKEALEHAKASKHSNFVEYH